LWDEVTGRQDVNAQQDSEHVLNNTLLRVPSTLALKISKLPLVTAQVLLVTSCASPTDSKNLSHADFKSSFFQDCFRITGIEDLHDSSWYSLDGTYEGNFTKSHVPLTEMKAGLQEWGREQNEGAKIIQ